MAELTRIDEEAIRWVMDYFGNELSNEELVQFDAWLAADSRHKVAFSGYKEAWDALNSISPGGFARSPYNRDARHGNNTRSRPSVAVAHRGIQNDEGG